MRAGVSRQATLNVADPGPQPRWQVRLEDILRRLDGWCPPPEQEDEGEEQEPEEPEPTKEPEDG